jgi:hypothetical protein
VCLCCVSTLCCVFALPRFIDSTGSVPLSLFLVSSFFAVLISPKRRSKIVAARTTRRKNTTRMSRGTKSSRIQSDETAGAGAVIVAAANSSIATAR